MPKITLIEHNGTPHLLDVDVGVSVMQAATNNMVPGMIADCGGVCSCATCHAYVDDAWLDKVPPPADMELGMIDCVMYQQPNSRLTCQINVTPELDGLVMHLPVSQT
jgi:2Fe-2S ferredoxin